MELLRRTPESKMRRISRRLGLLPVAATAIGVVPVVVSAPAAQAAESATTAPKPPTAQEMKTAHQALGEGLGLFRAQIARGAPVAIDMGYCYAWPSDGGRKTAVTANPGVNTVLYNKNTATAFVAGYDPKPTAATPRTVIPYDGAIVLRLHEGKTLQFSTKGAFDLQLVGVAKEQYERISQHPSLIPGTEGQLSDTELGSGQPVLDTKIYPRIPTGTSQEAQARELSILSTDCLNIDPNFGKPIISGPVT